ncbi:MAG: hypothetical protein RIT14_2897 [Pseudomonadota bacterium]
MTAPRPPALARAPRFPCGWAAGLLLSAILILPGCQGWRPASMLAFARGDAPADPALQAGLAPAAAASPIISDLMARPSILPQDSPYARVARAVLSAAPGVETAELGLARLRAEAVAANRWPGLTPVLTLDAIVGLAAQLLVDQPLMDHGRRKAERDRAAAELDLAAVTLSTRQNARVFDGLSLYLTAEQARVQGAIAEAATARLQALQQVVSARVAGGLSDRSEEQIIAQTVAEMQATHAADLQTRAQALADLGALAATAPPADLTGTAPLLPLPPAEPLSVLRATAEGARTLAEARISRAAALPGLSATAAITDQGVAPGLRLGGVRIGPGSPATLAVANAAPELVARQTADQRQTADRRRTELAGRVATLHSARVQGADVLRRTRENLDLYVDQYRMGRRSLTDLTAQTAAAARLERDQAALDFEIARLELELARDAGLLVEGGSL